MEKKAALALIFILFAAFCLRYYNLDAESLWLDEASSLKYSTTDQKDIGHPPFYYAILGFWVNVFGTSEFSIRFPALIFGVLSILALYFVVKTIFTKNVALLSSFLMAIAMFQVVYSQDARSYTLLSLLTIMSVFFFTQILCKNSVINYLFFAFAIILANYTHFLALLLIIGYNFIFYFWLITDKNRKKKWFVINIIILLSILPLLQGFSKNLPRLYSDFRNISALSGISLTTFHFVSIVLAIAMLVGAVGLLNLLNQKKHKFKEKISSWLTCLNRFIFRNQEIYLFFLLILFLVWLVFYVNYLDFFMSPYGQFVIRYSFFLVPLFYVLAALALTKIKSRNIAAFSLLLLILVAGFNLYSYYTSTTKEEWNPAAAYLSKLVQEQEIILVDASYMVGPLNYYLEKYSQNSKFKMIPLLSSTDQVQTLTNFTKILPELSSAHGQWLILSHNWRSEDFYKLQMDARYNLIQEKHYKDIDIYHYSGQRNEK